MKKRYLECMECNRKLFEKNPKRVNKGDVKYNVVTIDDAERRIECTCENGHKSVYYIQGETFELLFTLGIDSYLEGDYSAAVFHIAAAVDEFYRWSSKIILIGNRTDKKEIKELFKIINLSERQIGAFHILYLKDFGKNMKRFDEDKKKFRNDVIHKGALPTGEEAYSYMEYSYNFINSIIKKLREKHQEIIKSVTGERFVEIGHKYKDDIKVPPTTIMLPSIFFVTVRTDEENKSFKEKLDSYVEYCFVMEDSYNKFS